MKQFEYGYDFDGVVSAGIVPVPGKSAIITGNTETNRPRLEAKLQELGASDVPIYFFPGSDSIDKTEEIGSFKAEMIAKLGIQTFFEDTPEQVEIIQKANPGVKVVLIEHKDSEGRKPLKYIFFTFEGLCLPIAKKLIDEGNEVTVAQVQDIKELDGEGEEEPEMRKRRLSAYDGIVDKLPADKVLKVIESIEDKDSYFVFVDFNSMHRIGEALVAMGFKNGIFPMKKHSDMETDRNSAKKFVQKYYKGLEVAEEHEFKTIEEAEKFLETTDKVWVLKGNSDNAKTIVPYMEDPEMAKQLLLGNLRKGQKDYEDGGFILEEKIPNPIEFTPEAVFWNGNLVFTDIDMETKYRDAGDRGAQVGCGTSLVLATDLEAEINKIAFPEIIHTMAAEQPGLFVWDASILVDPRTGKKYFGEYCPMRFGWDSIFAEIAMSGDEDGSVVATRFFEAIVRGENPFQFKIGTTVRLYNGYISSEGQVKGGQIIAVDEKAVPNVYLYGVQQEEDMMHVCDYYLDVGVVTGFSNKSVEDAVDKMYLYVDMVTLNGISYRYKGDFLSRDYPTSLMNRYDYLVKNKII
jgi:hypothetical protein